MNERDRLNAITEQVIGAAMEVHQVVGPGLLESAYEACLVFELRQGGLKVEQQKPLPVIYKEVKLDCGYGLDLVVEDSVIVDQIQPITTIQLHLFVDNRQRFLLLDLQPKPLPVIYKEVKLDCGYGLDLVDDDRIFEIKA